MSSKKVKKKKDDGDNDWTPNPSKPAKTDNIADQECIIHCTDSKEKLCSPQSIESWKKLLEAAVVREFQAVLDIAESSPEGEIPLIRYHRKCRDQFTNKERLESIKLESIKREGRFTD